MFWECRQLRVFKSFPGGIPIGGFWSPGPHSKDLARSKRLTDQNKLAAYHRYWTKMVETYTSCGLTYGSDKLIALSGIAHEVHNSIRNDYVVAGCGEASC